MTLEDWNEIPIGTKVKYEDDILDKVHYGYFAGIFYPTRCIKVSDINYNDDFTGIKMTTYTVCRYIKINNVELFD